MKNYRRGILIPALAILVVFTTGCFGSKEVKVGASLEALTYDYWISLSDAVEESAAKNSMILTNYTTTEHSDEKQVQDIEKAIMDKVDYLIIGAYGTPEVISDALAKADEAGIKIIAVGMRSLDPAVDVNIHIDESLASEQAAGLFVDYCVENNISSGRTILVTGDEDNSNATHRAAGIVKKLIPLGVEGIIKYSESWGTQNAIKNVEEEIMVNQDDLVGFFGAWPGASEAIANANNSFGLGLFTVGFDLSPEMREMLKNGKLDAAIFQDPAGIGEMAINTILAFENGEDVNSTIIAETVVLTKDNIDQY